MANSLTVSQLYHFCDTALFSFTTTEELEILEQPIGQENALDAINFASSIEQDGFNLFAMGPSGSGKHSSVMSFLEQKASSEAPPKDWCYVNNFKDPRKPIAIDLPSGQAFKFKDDIDELIELLKVLLPSVFEGNTYRDEREAINQKYIDQKTSIFNHLEEEAKKHNISLNASSKSRITFTPIVDGKILSEEEFKAISGEKKEEINSRVDAFEIIVRDALHKVGESNRAMQKEFKEHDQKTTYEAVKSSIDELRQKYDYSEKITHYLDDLQRDIIHHVRDFLMKPEETNIPLFLQEYYKPSFTRYKVNLFISHHNGTQTAPVIFEDNPIHQNLIGRIEHLSQVGTLTTDFSMIKPGALHKANGGYLIIDARKLLMQPFAYEELKRVLRSKELRIESLGQQYSLISTITLEPEPIPINVKVILIGERILYYLLHHYDPEFQELFKVNADFEDDIPRNNENIQLYARMIGTIATRHNLLPFTSEAVARIIEQSSREVSHALKFSTHLSTLSDLLKESDYWARKNHHSTIEKSDIEKVLETRIQRLSRIQRKLYEQIDEETIMINVKGSTVGQINALSFISIGGYQFGLPSRVTARTRIGKGDIINIERKVELSGPIHAKGIMILSAYLGSTYASDLPLSLSASLVFEQSYGVIEGDSASSTELYALLSSLSGLPIKQNIAVTGSVNQFGEIQAIGGINEKIEGFFDICIRKDPEGFYGVIIPEANVKHLMLKKELLHAVEKEKFAIYTVKTIDEGISILTGIEAGKADEKGDFPPASVNGKVITRLKELSKIAKEFSQSKENKNNEEE
jgi:lon-related putative ATP-dependent protease